MLISDVAKAYEADKKIEGFSANTLNSYRIQAKLLIDYLGNIKTGNKTFWLFCKIKRKLINIQFNGKMVNFFMPICLRICNTICRHILAIVT